MRCDECASYHYFKQYLDMESLIDYFIFQIHFANYDWPFGNTKVWRYHNTLVEREPKLSQYFPSGLDGRFRWYLYDMDVAFAFNKAQNNDISQDDVIDSALRVGYERLIDNRFPFRNLFNDAAFQEHYFNRYANFLNTAFSPKQVNAEIDQLLAEIGSEMPHHLERWKKEKSLLGITCPQSYEEWMHQVNLLRVYSQYRVDGIRQNSLEKFAEVFKNYKMVKLTLSSNNIQAGGIKVHQTLFSENDLPFSGLYFPNLFLNLEAVPASGYRFVRWEGDVPDHKKTNDQLRLKLNQDYQLKAIFEKKSLF
jgi:hypothetical protein